MSLRMMSHLVKGLACIILVMFVYAVLFGWPHVLKKEVTPKTSEDEKPAHYLQEHFWKEDFSADEITSNPLSVDTAQLSLVNYADVILRMFDGQRVQNYAKQFV